MGESEACQVGGSEGSIAFHAIPVIQFNSEQFQHLSFELPGGVVEHRRGFLQGGHFLDQVVDAGGELGVQRYCCGRDLNKVNMNLEEPLNLNT